jgi:hypothetical protein
LKLSEVIGAFGHIHTPQSGNIRIGSFIFQQPTKFQVVMKRRPLCDVSWFVILTLVTMRWSDIKNSHPICSLIKWWGLTCAQ